MAWRGPLDRKAVAARTRGPVPRRCVRALAGGTRISHHSAWFPLGRQWLSRAITV